MQRWRVDWEGMAKPCEGQTAWDQRQVNSEWRTDANNSFIKKWRIKPAGQFSRFFIQSVTRKGVLKTFGGDAWRVYIRQGPSSLAPQVWDHGNGLYEVVFLAMEPGDYSAQITLDFTLCDGLRDPPVDWFVKGTLFGKYQADGILGYIGYDYIVEPLGGQTTFTLSVPENGNVTTGGFGIQSYSAVPDNASAIVAEKPVSPGDTLWIYGDSVAKAFLNSLKKRGTCEQYFKTCKFSYMWIYEFTSMEDARSKFEPNDFNKTAILQHMNDILESPDMRTQNSVFLFNLGVHYSISLNFTTYKDVIDNVVELVKSKIAYGNGNTAVPVWKTTTSIEKEKTNKMHSDLPRNKTDWRFHTHQRLELFHKYAVSAMCKAGILVLDVYQMTASYPDGTLDHVHYSDNVQRAAEDQLLEFITEEMNRKNKSLT